MVVYFKTITNRDMPYIMESIYQISKTFRAYYYSCGKHDIVICGYLTRTVTESKRINKYCIRHSLDAKGIK